MGLCGGHHHPVHRLYALGEYEADGYVQPYCDSPLDGEAVAESAYLNVLQHARDYVYIVTPYLIVDNEMVTALCLQPKAAWTCASSRPVCRINGMCIM